MNVLKKSVISARSLAVKYIAGLVLIALLSLSSYFIIEHLITTEQASAAIINVSGRQRMLAQKTALLSLQLADAADAANAAQVRAELARTVAFMELAHDGLAYGNRELGLPGGMSPEVQTLLFGKPVMLEAKLQEYWTEAKALVQVSDIELSDNNPHVRRIVALSGEIVDSLNMLVNQFQKESEARMARLQALQALVLSVMLAVLVLEALFIFQPAILTIRREAEELAAANAELTRLSSVDGLTGIANRRLFDDFFIAEWQRAVRAQQPITVIMADVDHFKLYNDTYGHQAGDECLRKVASVLNGTTQRTTDLVARYGGEEFVVVLPNTDTSGAAKVAERLRMAVEGLGIPHIASPVATVVTVSLGTATVRPATTGAPLEIIAHADLALYQAKQQGRNRAVVKAESS